MAIDLSIIVPVYNVEEYIEECLYSIIHQQKNSLSYEIIVVDDGSPDRSIELVESIASKNTDVRLRIVRQEKKGLGEARNVGIENANGMYIWCVDSDDTIHHASFSAIEKSLVCQPDIIAISAVGSGHDKMIIDREKMDGKVLTGARLLSDKSWTPCVPFNIINKSFLLEMHLKQMGQIYHEDIEFTPRMHYAAKRILILNDPLYVVRVNNESITRTENPKKSFDLIKIAKSLDTFRQKTVRKSDMQLFFRLISIVLNQSLRGALKMDFETKQSFKEKIFEDKQIFMAFQKSPCLKHRIEGWLFKLFPSKILEIFERLSV